MVAYLTAKCCGIVNYREPPAGPPPPENRSPHYVVAAPSEDIMHLIVFDHEIAVPVEEVEGKWKAARKGECGVGCLVLYDSLTDRFHVYDASTIEQGIQHLNLADVLVGFNSLDFDTPALEGFSGIAITPTQYDILIEIKAALGTDFAKGYKLNEVAKRTIERGKSGHGASAPILFKEGRHAELIDYCIADVALTRDLYRFIEENGYVITPGGDRLELTPPDEVYKWLNL